MEIIITAADANYFELVQGTILSIREKPQGRNAIVGFFDLGCTPEQIQWLQERVNIIKQPDWEFNFPSINEAPTHLKGLLARPFLRKYFPNFDIYLWIDADAWVQDWQAVDLFIQGAKRGGLAIVPEIDRGSEIQYGGLRKFWWQWVYNKYQAAFGEEVAENFYSYPVLNAGVFALHKDAPHWEVWAEYLERGLQQSVSLMTDQFALNLSVYQGGLFDQTEMLPAWCNWTYHHAFPSWDKEKSGFVEPYLPHTTIGILHLSGPEKEKQIQLKTTDQDVIELNLLYSPKLESSFLGSNDSLPVGDYVSPGFKEIQPDRCFPNMIVGDTNGCPWPYLRREIPHNWYADKRYPLIGFVSRDEAHILYNTALKFKGKKALEIGCWMGWSACHLALGGVELDVIDPILEKPEVYESVSNSLQAAGVLDLVKLIPGYSPEKVEEVAADGRKWSLIFIDGNHDAPGPLNDAIICETLAEADALILFHDLASPDVAQGLDYLKQRGWNTMIYQTMQIMGVAWRGNVEPVIHQPDPKIEWHLPEHLQSYLVSGMSIGRAFRTEVALNQVTDQLSPQQTSAYTNEYYELIQNGSRSSAQQIIPLLIELLQPFPPTSVVDVGCGVGNWLAVFKEFGIEDCLGIDGDYVDPNLLQIPLSQFTSHDLKQPLPIEKKFDLAISLEVAEHLPSECGEQFINSLTQLAPVILFSAAIPFQGGVDHFNEQWPQYWVKLFQNNGYAVVDLLRKKIWSNEKVEPWYAQNLFIFVKQECLYRYPELEKAYQNSNLSQLAIVHPKIYLYSLSTTKPTSKDDQPSPPVNVFLEPGKQPLVSVVIPCYNQAQFLPESVASVVAQTYENWEIVIVNDGSPDNTSEVARNLIAMYPHKSIRLIEKANGGLASARNAGIAAATGEYIMPLDADDKLSSNGLDYLMNISLNSEVPCVAFGSYKMFGLEHHIVNSYDLYSGENIKNFNMLHPSSLYHKSVWDLVKGYKEGMIVQGYEDWEFWVNCHRQNIPFLGTREVVINYRRTEGSMIGKAMEKHQQLLAQIIYYNWDIFDVETIKNAEEILEAAQITLAAAPTSARLKKELNLREINPIVFPEWNQPEELLLEELESIMRVLLTAPERSKITLLVESSNISKESAELAISDVVMKILYEEDLDIESVGEISFISQLNQREWAALRPMICARIIMKNENRSAIVESGCEHLPGRDIESFSRG